MTIFAEDYTGSGELHLHDAVADTSVIFHRTADTAVIEHADPTRRLNPPALRRPWANTGSNDTGEQPVWATGAEVAVGFDQPGQPRPPSPLPPPPDDTYPPIGPQPSPGPYPPPPPAPPKPSWAGPVAELPVVLSRKTCRHRAARADLRERLITVGLSLSSGAVAGGAVLAVAVVVAR